MKIALFIVSVAILLAGLLAAAGCTTGSDIRVQDLDGQWQTPAAADARATAMIFVTNDCPIANGYAPEINSIVSDYTPRGIRFLIVHVDPRLTREQAQAHAKAYGYRCAVIWDADHKLVKRYQASVTPEAIVTAPDGREILYRGCIDDRIVDFGKKRIAPSRRDLRDALDAILAGKPVPHPRTKAIGCAIPELSTP